MRAAPLGNTPGGRLLFSDDLGQPGVRISSVTCGGSYECRIIELPRDHPLFHAITTFRKSYRPTSGTLLSADPHTNRTVGPAPRGISMRAAGPWLLSTEHRPRRRVGMGGSARISRQVLDLCLSGGDQCDRLFDESLNAGSMPQAELIAHREARAAF
jgi:hypothetical protein